MPRGKTSGGKPPKRPIERYEHSDKKRINNPPVGLVTPETDPVAPTHKTYDYIMPVPSVKPRQELNYDPHLDPQLVWAGKKEHSSFEVPTVSLHVHERIDPHTIIEAVRKRNGTALPVQASLFERREENPPLQEAIDFYRHAHGWSNRLIAGDSLLVMNSLLEKEGMAGQVQMVYLDPPYGIKYGSNFQPFVNKREVKDGKDDDLTQEPEMIRAFRDTWELGIHSYLTYLRDRLLLSRELLHESGSCFVQISRENVHLVTNLLDEAFGPQNQVEVIAFRKKTMPLGGRLLEGICDYIVWYAKDKERVKYKDLFLPTAIEGDTHWNIALPSNTPLRKMTAKEIENHSTLPPDTDFAQLISLYPAGSFATGIYEFEYQGKKYRPPAGRSWKTPIEGMQRLSVAGRLIPYADGETLRYLLKFSDYPVSPLSNMWSDTSAPTDRRYPNREDFWGYYFVPVLRLLFLFIILLIASLLYKSDDIAVSGIWRCGRNTPGMVLVLIRWLLMLDPTRRRCGLCLRLLCGASGTKDEERCKKKAHAEC